MIQNSKLDRVIETGERFKNWKGQTDRICFLLVILLFPIVLLAQIPSNAIRISTVEQLRAIGGELSQEKYFVLTNDINLTGEWSPIYDFRGTFDGQGHSINNVAININGKGTVGFFGTISANNVTIKNVKVNVKYYRAVSLGSSGMQGAPGAAGGLVAYSSGSITIENCHVTGEITTDAAYAGGLLGYCRGETLIKNSHGAANVTASGNEGKAGGVVGNAEGILTIENSNATGNVSFSKFSGGILGSCRKNATTIMNCFSSGNVSASAFKEVHAGGIIGLCESDGTVIENSYSSGKITGTPNTGSVSYRVTCIGHSGGLIGSNSAAITIKNSYSTGDIIAQQVNDASDCISYAGGLIGLCSGTTMIENSYAAGTKTVFEVVGIFAQAKKVISGTVGGLVGINKGIMMMIVNCYAINDISGSVAGGFIGVSNSNSIITNCFSVSNISALRQAGGLIGSSGNTLTISGSYVGGSITVTSDGGSASAGGIAGIVSGTGTIENCYVTCSMSATAPNSSTSSKSHAGGIVGRSTGTVRVDKSYVTGNISALSSHAVYDVSSAGRFIGSEGGSVSSSYYLSTQEIKGSEIINTGGSSLTSEQMKTQTSFAGWDFAAIWTYEKGANNNFPVLRLAPKMSSQISTAPSVTTPVTAQSEPSTTPTTSSTPATAQSEPSIVSSNTTSTTTSTTSSISAVGEPATLYIYRPRNTGSLTGLLGALPRYDVLLNDAVIGNMGTNSKTSVPVNTFGTQTVSATIDGRKAELQINIVPGGVYYIRCDVSSKSIDTDKKDKKGKTIKEIQYTPTFRLVDNSAGEREFDATERK